MNLTRSKIEGVRKMAHKNIRSILKKLGVKGSDFGFRITGACPIPHTDSASPNDNTSAFSFDMNRKIWACFSNHCHATFGNDIFALIRSVFNIGFFESINWVIETLNLNDDSIPVVSDQEIADEFNKIKENKLYKHLPLSLDILNKLSPCSYFLSRGVSQKTLDELRCGGTYLTQGTFGFNRAIVPIFDPLEGYLVGFSGRDITNKSSRKWMHFRNFDTGYSDSFESIKTSHLIYNLYFIKNAGIKEIIMTEGPLDVIKLWDLGIKNSIAIFGTSFSNNQLDILLKTGIQSVTIMMDGDPPGQKAAQIINNKLRNYFVTKNICLSDNKNPKDLTLKELETINV